MMELVCIKMTLNLVNRNGNKNRNRNVSRSISRNDSIEWVWLENDQMAVNNYVAIK